VALELRVAIALVSVAIIAVASILVFINTSNERVLQQPSLPQGSRVTIGILPIIDSIPFIIAEQEGLFRKRGLDVELVLFSSARERDAAMEAGRIDVAVNDPVTSIIIISRGSGAKIVSLLLGQAPSDGVFYLLAPPNTSYRVEEVRSIAISRNTIIEFITDKMLELLGVESSAVGYVDVPSIPVRYQLLMEGKIQAATLPDPWGTMALMNGARLLARDDQFGYPISISVVIVSKGFASKPGSAEILRYIVDALNEALSLYKADPKKYMGSIGPRIQMPEALAGKYIPAWNGVIGPYPRSNFEMVSQWLYKKGLIQNIPSYEESVVFREGG